VPCVCSSVLSLQAGIPSATWCLGCAGREPCSCPTCSQPQAGSPSTTCAHLRGRASSLTLGACWMQLHTCPYQTMRFTVKALTKPLLCRIIQFTVNLFTVHINPCYSLMNLLTVHSSPYYSEILINFSYS